MLTVENETKETDNDSKTAVTATTDAHALMYETAQLWFVKIFVINHDLTGKNRADTEHG